MVENVPEAKKLLVLKDFSVLLIIVWVIVGLTHALIVPTHRVKAIREFDSCHFFTFLRNVIVSLPHGSDIQIRPPFAKKPLYTNGFSLMQSSQGSDQKSFCIVCICINVNHCAFDIIRNVKLFHC